MQRTFKLKLPLFLIGLFLNCSIHGMTDEKQKKQSENNLNEIKAYLEYFNTDKLKITVKTLTKENFQPNEYTIAKNHADEINDRTWKNQRARYLLGKLVILAVFSRTFYDGYCNFSSMNQKQTAIWGLELITVVGFFFKPWLCDKTRKNAKIIHRLGQHLDYEDKPKGLLGLWSGNTKKAKLKFL